MTSAIWRIFAELNNPIISPKLADKQVIKKKINIDKGKHVLACLYTKNYFEWIIKQLLNLAFIPSEE